MDGYISSLEKEALVAEDMQARSEDKKLALAVSRNERAVETTRTCLLLAAADLFRSLDACVEFLMHSRKKQAKNNE